MKVFPDLMNSEMYLLDEEQLSLVSNEILEKLNHLGSVEFELLREEHGHGTVANMLVYHEHGYPIMNVIFDAEYAIGEDLMESLKTVVLVRNIEQMEVAKKLLNDTLAEFGPYSGNTCTMSYSSKLKENY